MPYTEIQRKGKHKYYYRAKSVREKRKVKKLRRYMGVDLTKEELKRLEKKTDKLLADPLSLLIKKEEIYKLEKLKREYKKQPKENYENRYEVFISEFTYESNAIEGNTLNLRETASILFDKITPKGKELREINEAVNHKEAFDFMLNHKERLDNDFICKLQEILTKNTLRKDLEKQIGKYRTIQVWIRGASFTPTKPSAVEKEMKNLLRWYRRKSELHPVIMAAYFHSAFESIHPFVDGNGRTGRLLINFMLHKNRLPMINIRNKDRLKYYEYLNRARKGDLRPLVKMFYDILMSTKYFI